MFAEGNCGVNFWRDTEFMLESDFDVVSAVPARPESPKTAMDFRTCCVPRPARG